MPQSGLDLTKLVGDPLLDADNPQSDQEEDEIMSFKEHLAKQAAEKAEEKQLNLFTLASYVDEFPDEAAPSKKAGAKSKRYTPNPNGIAKFIVENFHFQKDDSNSKS